MTLVIRSRVVGSSKESMHWRRSVAATAILSVPLRSLVVSALFLLLFSLTLGVGVLILCDRRLRMKSRASLTTERSTSSVPPELPQWLLIEEYITFRLSRRTNR